MASLKLIPLDDIVVFPGMALQLPIDPGGESRVLLIPRHGTGFAKVGVVAEVSPAKRRNRGVASITALHRAVPGVAHADRDGVLRVDAEEQPDEIGRASCRV